jgi:LemA protein
MKKSKSLIITLIVVAVLIVIAVSFYTRTYNNLVVLSEETDAQWANVEATLQRRYDLIPNLVETVKGAMQQEQEVFGQIADARAKMAGAADSQERVAASNELEGALGRLLVVMENYPELKSSDNVTRLMDQLEGTENRISVGRTRYNNAVKGYNQTIKRFPTNIIAGRFNFEAKTLFEATPAASEAPKVNLTD